MRPALSAFWDAYCRSARASAAAELERDAPPVHPLRGVRLLTAALEEAQTLTELRASVLHLLPLSQNILRRPREAADLFGLGAGGRPHDRLPRAARAARFAPSR